MIDWASDTFKALIAAASLWVAGYVRKKAIPFFKILQDITKVVKRVEGLENEFFFLNEKVKAKIATDPNPLFVSDNKGDLIYANPAWGNMTGFSKIEDAYGKGYLQAIPSEDLELLEDLSDRQLKHPSSFEGKIRFKNIKTGEIIFTICRSELIRDKKGERVATIGRLLILKQ